MTENLPSGMSIWQDSVGNMYSVEPWSNERRESKIIKRTPDGKTSLFAGGNFGYIDGKKEKARFGIVIDMAFAENGSIYLTDSNRVRKIDQSGNVSTIYPKDNSQKNDSQLFGLTADKYQNVFVADFANKKLLKIDSVGKISTILASENDWTPLGVAAFDSEIYVLEGKTYESKSTGNRVVKISSDNRKTVVADLNDVTKTNNQPKSENVNFNLPSEQNNFSNSKSESNTNQTENKRLGLYAIIGAVIAAFAAFVFFRKNKFIN